MGWFDKFKAAFAPKNKNYIYADMLAGRTPIYSSWGRDVYASDVVTQAKRCVTDEIMKLAPTHVVRSGADLVPAKQGDSLQRILNAPNHYMTTAEFLSKVMHNYYVDNNSWVIPTYKMVNGRKVYTGLYPVTPDEVIWLEDPDGQLLVKLNFGTKTEEPWILPYSDIIHLRRDYGASEYMGGNEDGRPDNSGLQQTVEINEQMLSGINKAMSTSQAVNGVVKYGSILSKEKMAAAIEVFEAQLQSNKSGILAIDMQSEYIPITRDIKMVDAETLQFIDKKILRHFRVPLDVLAGDYSKETYEAFYQSGIEPIVILLSQEFTRVLFSPNERAHGNEIKFYPKELIFMSVEQTIQMINLLAPTGGMYENEKRVAFGLRPLEELEGKRYISLNWIDANRANEYQTGTTDTKDTNDNGGEGDNNE